LLGGLLGGGNLKKSSGAQKKRGTTKDGRVALVDALKSALDDHGASDSDIDRYRAAYDAFKAAEGRYLSGDRSEAIFKAFAKFLSTTLTNASKIQSLAEQADNSNADLAKAMIEDSNVLRDDAVAGPWSLQDKIAEVIVPHNNAFLTKAAELDYLDQVEPWKGMIYNIVQSALQSGVASQAKDVLSEIKRLEFKNLDAFKLYCKFRGPPPDDAPTKGLVPLMKFYRDYYAAELASREPAEEPAVASATVPQRHELKFFIEIWPYRERLQWLAHHADAADETSQTATAKDILSAWNEVHQKLIAVLDGKESHALSVSFRERLRPPPAKEADTDAGSSSEGRTSPQHKKSTKPMKQEERLAVQKGTELLEKWQDEQDKVDGDESKTMYQKTVRCLIPTLQRVAANEDYSDEMRGRASAIVEQYKNNRSADEGSIDDDNYEDCAQKAQAPVPEPEASPYVEPPQSKPRGPSRFFRRRDSTGDPSDNPPSDTIVTEQETARDSTDDSSGGPSSDTIVTDEAGNVGTSEHDDSPPLLTAEETGDLQTGLAKETAGTDDQPGEIVQQYETNANEGENSSESPSLGGQDGQGTERTDDVAVTDRNGGEDLSAAAAEPRAEQQHWVWRTVAGLTGAMGGIFNGALETMHGPAPEEGDDD
jgi:hypothetical protein